MPRLAAVLVLIALSAARADVAPPPGHQRVPVDHILEAEQSFPGYEFFVIIGADAAMSYRCELGPDTPVRIAGAGRAGRAQMCWLAAVPKAAAEELQDDAAILRAIIARSIPGTLKSSGFFDPFVVLPSASALAVVERRHQVRRLTPEEGIVVTTVSDSSAVGAADGSAALKKALLRWAVAAMAVAAAVLGLGVWFRSRKRTQPNAGQSHHAQ